MTKLLLVEIWRWAQLCAGWLLLILGPLVGGPLPGPFGIIGFAAGLVLVLRNSRWARRFFIRLKRRHPQTVGPVRHALKRGVNLSTVIGHAWSALRAHLPGLRRRDGPERPAAGASSAEITPEAAGPGSDSAAGLKGGDR